MKNIKNKPILLLTLLLSIFCVNIVLSGSVSATTIHINDSSAYNASSVSLNQQIQNKINSASKGDTVEFMGNYYENLSLVINKPLNIISRVKTIISGPSNSVTPIFLITGSGSSGTNIIGFNLQTENTDGIAIRNTGKITIFNNNLTTINGTGIIITGSSNININNNLIKGSKTGLSIINSKNVAVTRNNIKNSANNGIDVGKSQNITINKNQISSNDNEGVSTHDSQTITVEENSISNNAGNGITLKNSSKTKINKNDIIKNKGHGIYFDENVKYTQITSNNINNNQKIGIALDKSGANTYINGNTITGNQIGININHSSDNLVISQNLITDSVRNADDETSGVGINFGINYWYSPTFDVNNNAIFNNQRREVEIKDTQETVIFGANWYGHSLPSGCNLCPKCHTGYIQAVVTQSGGGVYTATFYTDYAKKIVADKLPSFYAYFFLSDGTILEVPVVNGIARIKIDPSLKVILIKTTNQRHEPKDIINVPTPVDDNTDPNDDSEGDNSDNGQGGHGSDNGAGDGTDSNGNSGSGSNSGSSSNDGKSNGFLAVGAAAAASASSAGQDGSSSSQTGSKSTAQELVINNPVKNPQIWGIIGITVLIFLVAVAYYRRDLMNMIKNSK